MVAWIEFVPRIQEPKPRMRVPFGPRSRLRGNFLCSELIPDSYKKAHPTEKKKMWHAKLPFDYEAQSRERTYNTCWMEVPLSFLRSQRARWAVFAVLVLLLRLPCQNTFASFVSIYFVFLLSTNSLLSSLIIRPEQLILR